MSVNKVIYGNRTLIDLTGDTVTEKTLLKGCKAHGADGRIIVGTMLSGCPAEFFLEEDISDSSGGNVKDKAGNAVKGKIKYLRV